jgi:phosphoribosylformylglycinamidine cyclo-ligase
LSAPNSAYARSGVSQDRADAAVDSIVGELSQIKLAGKTRQALKSGHFANVIRVSDQQGIALSTDGVGTKVLIAQALKRYDTIGIDCVGMNVNDVVCVGAEPVAMLDYIATAGIDPQTAAELGHGLRIGAERAGIEIPGGELAQLDEIMDAFDVVGACFGLVELDQIVTGEAVAPGDVVIGLPSNGLHANGYTLARKALKGVPLDDTSLGAPLGEILLRPTEIYVPAILDLLRSSVDVRGLAHITSKGLDNLLRLRRLEFEIDDWFEIEPVFDLIKKRGDVSDDEMYEVFNMGCGFCCIVPEDQLDSALSVLKPHYPSAKRIGSVGTGPAGVHRVFEATPLRA